MGIPHPHPLKCHTGYDPGNPDHVEALDQQHGRTRVTFTYGDHVVANVFKRDAEAWLAKARANAQECQRDRAGDAEHRLARIHSYLRSRARRAVNRR